MCVLLVFCATSIGSFSPTFLQNRLKHTHISLYIFSCVPKCCRYSPCTASPLKRGPIGFSKRSKTNYLFKLRKNTKELRPQLHCSRSLTSQMLMGIGALQEIPSIWFMWLRIRIIAVLFNYDNESWSFMKFWEFVQVKLSPSFCTCAVHLSIFIARMAYNIKTTGNFFPR